MNTMINEVPAGEHSRAEKQAFSVHNARSGLHCMGAPADWGWRRPSTAELVAERLADLEEMLGELG
jgi:hypothetical protein